jgi:hypothetical protein
MRKYLATGHSSPQWESDRIETISVLLCIAAIVAAFFSRPLAWVLLQLPFGYFLLTGLPIRSAKLARIPELSDNANIVLEKWRFHYLRPDLCTMSRAISLAAVVVAILGCFFGFHVGLVFGVTMCLLAFGLVPVFNPNGSMHTTRDFQGHEEVIAFISRKLENESTEVPTIRAYIIPEGSFYGQGIETLQPSRTHSSV